MNKEAMKYETDGDLIRLTLERLEVLNAVHYQGTQGLPQRPRRSTTTPTPEPRSSGAMGGRSVPALTSSNCRLKRRPMAISTGGIRPCAFWSGLTS
jgi:hypothetical protein